MNAHQADDARFQEWIDATEAALDAAHDAAMIKAIAEDYALGINHDIWAEFNAWPVGARAACIAAHNINRT